MSPSPVVSYVYAVTIDSLIIILVMYDITMPPRFFFPATIGIRNFNFCKYKLCLEMNFIFKYWNEYTFPSEKFELNLKIGHFASYFNRYVLGTACMYK